MPEEYVRPPMPPDSPLRCLFLDQPGKRVPSGLGALIMMFQKGLYGSLAISIPLIGTMLVGIVLSTNNMLHLRSPYGANPTWLIVLCVLLFLAHTVTFIAAVRKVRRNPADPRPLVAALRRSPWILWLFALLLLAEYPYQHNRAPLFTAALAAIMALLTHLAVWASLRNRRLEPESELSPQTPHHA